MVILITIKIRQGAYNSGKHGKFREFKIYSGNLSDAVDCDIGHRVVCIIVSNSSVNWLSNTATGMDGASHHAPSIKYSVILQESWCELTAKVICYIGFSLYSCLEKTV